MNRAIHLTVDERNEAHLRRASSADLVTHGLHTLPSHPDQRADLRADVSLASAVVEETLRFRGPVEITPPRYALADVEFAGGVIPAFDRVALSQWGATRDPSVFTDPDTFDFHRADSCEHIAFGHGIHFCLGAPLARLEGRIMFERIAEQLPGLRLADAAPRQAAPGSGALLLRT